jgi:hypothetical protein
VSAAAVQAVIAAALADPRRLLLWRNDPKQLAQHGLDGSSIDWDGLLGLAAVSTKVRHNPLRGDLPVTFRALEASGLEHDLFRAYAPRYAELRDGQPDLTQIRRAFVAFLAEWLPGEWRDRRPAKVLVETASHELRVAELRESIAAPPEDTAGPSDVPAFSRPHRLALCAMHPGDATAAVSQGCWNREGLRPHRMIYLARADGIDLAELDPLCWWIAGHVDGKRTVKQLSELLATELGEDAESMVQEGVSALRRAGVLRGTAA